MLMTLNTKKAPTNYKLSCLFKTDPIPPSIPKAAISLRRAPHIFFGAKPAKPAKPETVGTMVVGENPAIVAYLMLYT